jgi:hypothetical protein
MQVECTQTAISHPHSHQLSPVSQQRGAGPLAPYRSFEEPSEDNLSSGRPNIDENSRLALHHHRQHLPIPSTSTHSIHSAGVVCQLISRPLHSFPAPIPATRAAVTMSAISRATYRGASALSGLRAQNATAYVDTYSQHRCSRLSQY